MTIQHPIIDPGLPLSKAETFYHKGFRVPDPFAPRRRPGASFVDTLLATALFRCWHILVFFSAWSTLITILNENGHSLVMQPTILTVAGTVLGFVISYRTTSSFERYNEGRRLWSQIILASRTMARTIWFHVPSTPPTRDQPIEEARARCLVEKKSAINLLEAFAVAMKHYLRGEDGIYYSDLYYLVKFLPAYVLPARMPQPSKDPPQKTPESPLNSQSFASSMIHALQSPLSLGKQPSVVLSAPPQDYNLHSRNTNNVFNGKSLPRPVSVGPPGQHSLSFGMNARGFSFSRKGSTMVEKDRIILQREDEVYLLPAELPPKYGFFDIFPFSLLVKYLTEKGKEVKGKKAALVRAKMKNESVSHNLPLELSLYLSSYIALLQNRKICDVPTTNTLITSLNQLVDSLTGLERILTSPIPFSYSVHLWTVTNLYCLVLPFQIYATLKWVTIPCTILISFIFFGFLVAGEEIENPFGYDKNNLNLDHFTYNIIRNELRTVTSAPPPDPERWAFVAENNMLFTNISEERCSPEEWISRGAIAMQRSLGQY